MSVRRVTRRITRNITRNFVVGFHAAQWRSFRDRKLRLERAARELREPEPVARKEWRPKQPQIQRLSSYEGEFPPEYWELWPRYRPICWRPQSWISGHKLEAEARECGYPHKENLRWATDLLEHGAHTGVKGAGRLPSAGNNAKSAILNGHLLSDSLAEWVRLQLMAGPFDLAELPWQEIKISPLGIQVKPSGAGRILVDMSYPWRDKGERIDVHGSVPISPNDAINLEDYPAAMDGTPKILSLLIWWGPGCYMAKDGNYIEKITHL